MNITIFCGKRVNCLQYNNKIPQAGCYNNLDWHFSKMLSIPFPKRRRLTWTTIVIKIIRTANGAAPANPEAGMARVVLLPAQGGAVPPPIAVMIAVHPIHAGQIPVDMSEAAPPRIAPAHPASMAGPIEAALP